MRNAVFDHKVRVTALLFLAAILLTSGLGCLGKSSPFSLRVDSLNRDRVLLDVPVNPGDRFYIDYIHSSAKTPIRSTFEVGSEGQMVLVEESFLWYGAGLESVEHPGVRIISKEGETRVLLDRHFPSLRLRVGCVANHRLTFNGRTIPLKEIAEGRELLKIWIRKDR